MTQSIEIQCYGICLQNTNANDYPVSCLFVGMTLVSCVNLRPLRGGRELDIVVRQLLNRLVAVKVLRYLLQFKVPQHQNYRQP